ncbi:MAG: hypothetical protein KIT84_28205 [Labilithrix sp.]|nr:hypothetical protein [Labilithrix sp.]MCW5814942.1 hypothetical protein [Labilithrix sp.]
MPPRLSLALAGMGLAGLVACASIAGLDKADPPNQNGLSPGDDDDDDQDAGSIATESGLTISPSTLTIPEGKCGDDEKESSLTLYNGSDKPVPYEVFIGENDVFSIDGASVDAPRKGTVAPGGRETVKVKAKPKAPGTANVQIIVSAGEGVKEVRTIDASMETSGATLAVNPTLVDFGTLRADANTADKTAVFVNDGNQPITIKSFDQTGDEGFATESAITIGAREQVAVKFSAAMRGVDANVVSATFTPVIEGPLCGSAPTVKVEGQRTNQAVIVPPSVDVGRVNCKSAPTAGAKLTIANYSTTSGTVKITGASKFATSGDTPIGAGNSTTATTADITFTPTAAAVALDKPGPIEENVTITVTRSGHDDVVRPVKVKALVVGSVLSVSKTWNAYYYYSLDNIPDNRTGVGKLTNSGNAPTCLRFSLTGAQANVFRKPSDRRAEVGDAQLSVPFDASYNGTYRATLGWERLASCSGENAPICSGATSIEVVGKR